MTAFTALSLRMDKLRDQQLAWLRHIESTSGKTLTEIARASGINPSTFSKFVNNKQGHTLTEKIVHRVEEATRVPAYESNVEPRLKMMTEEEGQRYHFNPRTDNILEIALKEAMHDSNNLDLWTLRTTALSAVGLQSGMIVVVDRNATARNGDAVLAIKSDKRRGTAEAMFRVYRAPYLLEANSQGEPGTPEIVDNDRVVIEGVITGAFHIRH